jgi:hypothetical protein
MWKASNQYRAPEGDGESSGGDAAPPAAPAAAAPAAPSAPAPNAAPAPTAAAPTAPGAPAAPAEPASGKPAEPAAPEPTKAIWPANWRETVSKDDAKKLTRLQRYASPEAAIDALIEAQNRISKGELKPVLGKNPTPEQVAEYRAAVGIPEAPEKYDLGEAGKAIDSGLLSEVLKEAHATNQTPDQVKGTLNAWKAITNKVAEERAAQDLRVQQETEDALRQEWGVEYTRTINLIHSLLDGNSSQPLKQALLGGRLADGTPVGSNPGVLRMLASLALIQNPAGVVVPGAHADPMQGVEDEISKIETTMRKDRAGYNKDEKMQARYRELLVARETLKPRRAA